MADPAVRVKLCGMTEPTDAEAAARAGADFIGVICSPRSKRHADPDRARAIADVARTHGVTPVAVFVDEDAKQILKICAHAGITAAQLHGDGARATYPEIRQSLRCIVALTPDNVIDADRFPAGDEWPYFLLDHPRGGTGKTLDWTRVKFPAGKNCFLAGGLTPDNVADAVRRLRPFGVDTASGIERDGSVRKDPEKMRRFVAAAKNALYTKETP